MTKQVLWQRLLSEIPAICRLQAISEQMATVQQVCCSPTLAIASLMSGITPACRVMSEQMAVVQQVKQLFRKSDPMAKYMDQILATAQVCNTDARQLFTWLAMLQPM